uniref:Helitron helicase-like domain-containing protein n=1 Tax=Tanacetum cinerariifolium TaxID=118510 RepID=A0A6L2N6Y9_TANCI|nr:helitron helicase-like domain-containing protein [Tanacetum cinerariifolium]
MGNILNRVETFATFDALDNVSSGYGPGKMFHLLVLLWQAVIAGSLDYILMFSESVLSFVLFQIVRDKCRELDILEFKIRIYNAEGARGYELPTSNALGAMVFENGISNNANFDFIIQHRDGTPQRVNKLHPSYMSLQFPLLFIYGQPGVFEQKIQSLIGFLKKERIFGDVTGVSRIRIGEDVDRFISAKLPDPRKDPEGYNVVLELMLHGPYGVDSLKALCMKGTNIVFARVARPIGESSTTATPSRHVIDEIQNYVEGCFICAHEAYWRLLKFDIHRHKLAVQILAVHLEDMQRVTFRDQDRKSWSPQQIIYWMARVCASNFRLIILFKNVTMSSKRLHGFLGSANCQDVFYPTYRAACQALGLLDEDPKNTSWVHIPPAYCLPPDEQGLSKLIDFIYDQSTLHIPSATSLQQKAIVCPKNEMADIINLKVLDMMPGESTIYMSQDEAHQLEMMELKQK